LRSAALRATATAELSYRFSALCWRLDQKNSAISEGKIILASHADSRGANKSLKRSSLRLLWPLRGPQARAAA